MSSITLPPEALTLENIFAIPDWTEMPYQLVLVRFYEGSAVFLDSEDVAFFAAEVLAIENSGVPVEAHLVAQVLPAVIECPERLVEIAAMMPFNLMRKLQFSAKWKSPAITLGDDWPSNAEITLWHTKNGQAE